jgi:hypothetical protein
MGRCLTVRTRFCLCAILIVSLGLSAASCAHQRESDVTIISRLPFGGVNVPQGQQKITGKVDFTGWALSEEGIESVAIYIDRSFVAECATGLPRPDVAKAFPNIPESLLSGWTVTFDSTNFPPGWHELTVQVKSKAGATRDVGSVPILLQR